MKKTLALLLALLMVFALFAGCSKKEDKSDTSGGSSGGGSSIAEKYGYKRYPAENGKSNYTKPEGILLTQLDKADVHPSDTATFKFGMSAHPSSLCNYTDLGSNYANLPVAIFYDSLVYYNTNTGEVVPGIAESWERLDEKTYEFKIRKDVKSHLGDPLTASDILFTFAWGCENPKLANTFSSVFDIDKWKVVDDYTIDIVTKDVIPFVLYDLTKINNYTIVVEESVNKLGGKEAAGQNPLMATGPYKFTKWDQADQTIYGERNDDYWAAPPYYKNIEMHVSTDTTSRCMGVESGDFDFGQSPSSNAVLGQLDNPDIATYITGGTAVLRLDFNSSHAPLNVKEARQAIALAINYPAIQQVSYSGYSDPSDSIYPYTAMWHTSPKDGEKEFYFYQDIERAKEKLKEAGYPDGFEFSIMYTSGKPEAVNGVEVLQNNLAEIGIKVKLDQFEAATYNDRTNKGEYDSRFGATLNSTPTSTIKQIDPRYQHFCGEDWFDGRRDEIIDLMDKCMYTADIDKDLEYVAQFQDVTRELVPCVPTASPMNFNMFNADIVNLAFDYTGNPILSQLFPAEYLGL